MVISSSQEMLWDARHYNAISNDAHQKWSQSTHYANIPILALHEVCICADFILIWYHLTIKQLQLQRKGDLIIVLLSTRLWQLQHFIALELSQSCPKSSLSPQQDFLYWSDDLLSWKHPSALPCRALLHIQSHIENSPKTGKIYQLHSIATGISWASGRNTEGLGVKLAELVKLIYKLWQSRLNFHLKNKKCICPHSFRNVTSIEVKV